MAEAGCGFNAGERVFAARENYIFTFPRSYNNMGRAASGQVGAPNPANCWKHWKSTEQKMAKMSREIAPERLKVLLRGFVLQNKSQTNAAAALGISQSYLHDILSGKRPVSQRVLDYFNIEKRVVYRFKS